MTTYNLQVTADPTLSGRRSPNGEIHFPNGFNKGDVLVAASVSGLVNNMLWYEIKSATRNGNPILLSQPTWAGAGSSHQFLKILSTSPDPIPQPPAEVQPIRVSAGITTGKTVVVEIVEPNGLPVEKVTVISAGVTTEYVKKP